MNTITDETMNEYEENDDPHIRKLALHLREASKELLLCRIKDLGRRYLGGEVVPDLDKLAWKAIVEGPVTMTEEEVIELEAISSQAGGWWRLDGLFVEFVDLETWEKHYKEAL